MKSLRQFFQEQKELKLNPKFWEGKNLKPEVRKGLIRIGDYWADSIGLPPESVVDMHLVGGNASYLYNAQSDLDLHLIVDKSKVSECEDLLDDYLRARKKLWSFEQDVTIYGTEVEVYAEDVDDPRPARQGRYSLKKGRWITEPSAEAPLKDDIVVQSRVKDLEAEIDEIIDTGVANEAQLKWIKERVFKLRRQSIQQGGEFAQGNLVFKQLRNAGYVDKLNEYLKDVVDKNLSIT
jgi:DNA-binding Lrp family transcriptional regulator